MTEMSANHRPDGTGGSGGRANARRVVSMVVAAFAYGPLIGR